MVVLPKVAADLKTRQGLKLYHLRITYLKTASLQRT